MVGLRRSHLVKSLNPGAQDLDVSSTQTLNALEHSGRRLILNVAATAVTLTLPNATGTGNTYEFYVQLLNTSTYVIQTGTADDEFVGMLAGCDADATPPTSLHSDAAIGDNFDTCTIGDVTRGLAGSWVKFTDIATNVWKVEGSVIKSGGSEATPFTSAV